MSTFRHLKTMKFYRSWVEARSRWLSQVQPSQRKQQLFKTSNRLEPNTKATLKLSARLKAREHSIYIEIFRSSILIQRWLIPTTLCKVLSLRWVLSWQRLMLGSTTIARWGSILFSCWRKREMTNMFFGLDGEGLVKMVKTNELLLDQTLKLQQRSSQRSLSRSLEMIGLLLRTSSSSLMTRNTSSYKLGQKIKIKT